MIAGGTIFGGLPAGLTTGAAALADGSLLDGVFALFTGWIWGMVLALIPAFLGTGLLQNWASTRGPVSEMSILAIGGALGLVVVLFITGGGSMILTMGAVCGVSGALGAMKARDWFGARS